MRVFAEGGPADWYKNSIVGGRADDWPYVLGFREGADAIVERAVADRSQDLLFYAAAFNYRHALELALKIAIGYAARLINVSAQTGTAEVAELQRVRDFEKKIDRMHDVRPLLDELDRMLRLFTDDPWPAETLDAIRELADVDPTGQAFRYSQLSRGKGIALPATVVNIDNLKTLGLAVDFTSRRHC